MAQPQIDIAAVVAALNRTVEQATTAIAIEVTAELQQATPVDTGFARASWVPSIGVPSAEMGGTPQAPDAGAAETGLARVARFKLSDGRAYVSNNTRYIGILDRGSSRQAPAGFVRASIERGLQAAREVLRASSPQSRLPSMRVVGGA